MVNVIRSVIATASSVVGSDPAYSRLGTVVSRTSLGLFCQGRPEPHDPQAELARLTMEDPARSVQYWLLAIAFTYGVGLTPSLLIRYVFARRPLPPKSAKWISVAIGLACWTLFVFVHFLFNEKSSNGVPSILIFFISRWILTRGYTVGVVSAPNPSVPARIDQTTSGSLSSEGHNERPQVLASSTPSAATGNLDLAPETAKRLPIEAHCWQCGRDVVLPDHTPVGDRTCEACGGVMTCRPVSKLATSQTPSHESRPVDAAITTDTPKLLMHGSVGSTTIAPSTDAKLSKTIEYRLAEARRLFERGLITESEYAEAKRRMIQEL
jgi:hypothetical protein